MEWHPFFYKGHETNVEVNKLGEICLVPKYWMKSKRKRKYAKYSINKGYYKIGVNIKNIGQKTIKVHQIMAVVFLNHEICGHKYVVDHIDENKLNNRLENLQILSNKQNILKSINYKKKLKESATN